MCWLGSLSRLLEISPALASTLHDGGWYPIHAAVLTGDIRIVKLISGRCNAFGVSFEISSSYSSSISPHEIEIRKEELGERVATMKLSYFQPLHLACLIGNIDIIKYLVDCGAQMKVPRYQNRNPVDMFDVDEHEDAFKFFCALMRSRKEKKRMFKEGQLPQLRFLSTLLIHLSISKARYSSRCNGK